MSLVDWEIRSWGKDLISPFKQEHVQPASIDLTLDNLFIIPRAHIRPIDLGDVSASVLPNDYKRTRVKKDHRHLLSPQTFVLGSTVETVKMPATLVGRVEGKSSLGRLGLLVHSTAGFIDPGFQGKVTLEFYNLSPRSIMLRPGLRICQISFETVPVPDKPYGSKGLNSKYQGQTETTPSRYQG